MAPGLLPPGAVALPDVDRPDGAPAYVQPGDCVLVQHEASQALEDRVGAGDAEALALAEKEDTRPWVAYVVEANEDALSVYYFHRREDVETPNREPPQRREGWERQDYREVFLNFAGPDRVDPQAVIHPCVVHFVPYYTAVEPRDAVSAAAQYAKGQPGLLCSRVYVPPTDGRDPSIQCLSQVKSYTMYDKQARLTVDTAMRATFAKFGLPWHGAQEHRTVGAPVLGAQDWTAEEKPGVAKKRKREISRVAEVLKMAAKKRPNSAYSLKGEFSEGLAKPGKAEHAAAAPPPMQPAAPKGDTAAQPNAVAVPKPIVGRSAVFAAAAAAASAPNDDAARIAAARVAAVAAAPEFEMPSSTDKENRLKLIGALAEYYGDHLKMKGYNTDSVLAVPYGPSIVNKPVAEILEITHMLDITAEELHGEIGEFIKEKGVGRMLKTLKKRTMSKEQMTLVQTIRDDWTGKLESANQEAGEPEAHQLEQKHGPEEPKKEPEPEEPEQEPEVPLGSLLEVPPAPRGDHLGFIPIPGPALDEYLKRQNRLGFPRPFPPEPEQEPAQEPEQEPAQEPEELEQEPAQEPEQEPAQEPEELEQEPAQEPEELEQEPAQEPEEPEQEPEQEPEEPEQEPEQEPEEPELVMLEVPPQEPLRTPHALPGVPPDVIDLTED